MKNYEEKCKFLNSKKIVLIIIAIIIVVIVVCTHKFKLNDNKIESTRTKFFTVNNLIRLSVISNEYGNVNYESGYDKLTVKYLKIEDGVLEDGYYFVAKDNELKEIIKVKINGVEGSLLKSYIWSNCNPDSMGRCMETSFQIVIINDKGDLYSSILHERRDVNPSVVYQISDFLSNTIDDENNMTADQIEQLTDILESVELKKVKTDYKIVDSYRIYYGCGYKCEFKSFKLDNYELDQDSVFVESEDGTLLKLDEYTIGKPMEEYMPYILKFDSILALNSDYNLFLYNDKNYSVKQIEYNNNSIVVNDIAHVSNYDEFEFIIFDENSYAYGLDVISSTKYTIKRFKKYKDYLYKDGKMKINYEDGTNETININTESGEIATLYGDRDY